MSLESSLGLFLDVLIVVLLVAAIGFGFVLNRRLTGSAQGHRGCQRNGRRF